MATYTIMIQVGNRTWTAETLHSAAVLARQMDAEIVLVKMLPVQYPGWLGTDLGYLSLTEQDGQNLQDYVLTLEDYGIHFSIHIMQYTALIDALVQAADQLHAQVVFAQLPGSLIPYWHRLQTALLRRCLAHHQHQLFEQPVALPEPPVEELIPAPQP
jgi:hypothetical protein